MKKLLGVAFLLQAASVFFFFSFGASAVRVLFLVLGVVGWTLFLYGVRSRYPSFLLALRSLSFMVLAAFSLALLFSLLDPEALVVRENVLEVLGASLLFALFSLLSGRDYARLLVEEAGLPRWVVPLWVAAAVLFPLIYLVGPVLRLWAAYRLLTAALPSSSFTS